MQVDYLAQENSELSDADLEQLFPLQAREVFFIQTRIEVDAESVSQVEKLLIQSAKCYWNQTGILDFQAYRGIDPVHFITWSRWVSQEDYHNYLASEAWKEINCVWNQLLSQGLVHMKTTNYEPVE